MVLSLECLLLLWGQEGFSTLISSRPDQENILAVVRFENSAGNGRAVSKVVHVIKGTFPLLSQRREQIGQLLPGAQTPSRPQSLLCSPNQCLPLSLYASTAPRKIHMMKALLHIFFSVLRIKLRFLHIGNTLAVNYTPNPCLFLTQGQLAILLRLALNF